LAPAYVLHQYAYRDTGRILEVFTAEHGRLTLFARGASGAKSTLKGILRPFQRLLLSWSGRTEACALATAEIDGVPTNLSKERLMSGFYLNELLLKLTERWDPHPEIFFSYAACIEALCAGDGEEAALRRFEKRLLNDEPRIVRAEIAKQVQKITSSPDGRAWRAHISCGICTVRKVLGGRVGM